MISRPANIEESLFSHIIVLVKGGGDLASGVAWRLHQCGFRILMTETAQPMAVRRHVAFCEAVYNGEAVVEGVKAVLIRDAKETEALWDQGDIPMIVDPECNIRHVIKPDVLVDGIMAKRNIGTTMDDAPLVIAMGPGFEAGVDAHFVVETNRGHYLGRLLKTGKPEPHTGVPGPVQGITTDRVIRAPADGEWLNRVDIGETVHRGDLLGTVGGEPVRAKIDGVIRGLIHPGLTLTKGRKTGDIDPRDRKDFCDTISEKALAISGGVLEGILRKYGH